MSYGPSISVIAGIGVDACLGEPPTAFHPVAWFGTAAGTFERFTYRPSRVAGAAHWALATGAAFASGVALERTVGRRVATTLAVGVACAHRMLIRETEAVALALARGDVASARTCVAGLVGRDVASLDATDITRATVETLAENTVDAATATTVWALMGGAPAVLAHRAVNTLDAMVGHRSPRYERFGWASARADDLANWVPARATVVAVVLARPHRTAAIARAVRDDARRHPSPNAGVVEAAFAAALGVSLGGTNRYDGLVEDRGRLGDGPAPTAADIGRAITLSRHCAVVVAILGGACAHALARVRRRR
ncbi:cobalamin biosynthesis protein [soil metagenome]